jgi:hypothetical protein
MTKTANRWIGRSVGRYQGLEDLRFEKIVADLAPKE